MTNTVNILTEIKEGRWVTLAYKSKPTGYPVTTLKAMGAVFVPVLGNNGAWAIEASSAVKAQGYLDHVAANPVRSGRYSDGRSSSICGSDDACTAEELGKPYNPASELRPMTLEVD